MKTLQIDLPDQMAREVEDAVAKGVFANPADAVCAALREYFRRHRLELVEQQQLQDIAWALQEKPSGK